MRGRDKFLKYKKIIFFLIKIFSYLPYKVNRFLLEYFRMTTGNKGLLIRYILLKILAKNCGDNVSIHPNVYLYNIHNLSIGNNISIHPMCYIDAYGKIKIGDSVSIAHSSTIMSTEHIFDDLDIDIKDQDCRSNMTVIESNVWIGAGCRILAGSTLEEGSILAAGSVLKTIVNKNTIYGGIPAKFIKKR